MAANDELRTARDRHGDSTLALMVVTVVAVAAVVVAAVLFRANSSKVIIPTLTRLTKTPLRLRSKSLNVSETAQ